MPRKRRRFEEPLRGFDRDLARQLADELKSGRESGQPMIDEAMFPAGTLRVAVIWDAWDRLPLEERTDIILQAYEWAEGHDYREKIALASGLTVPEAHSAGMLPFQIIPALRREDPFTPEQIREAMIEEGATVLFGADRPQLRSATREEAEAVRHRLARRIPRSEQVWVITEEVGRVEDWAQR